MPERRVVPGDMLNGALSGSERLPSRESMSMQSFVGTRPLLALGRSSVDDQPRGVDHEIGLRQLNVMFAAGCEDLRRRRCQVDQIALCVIVAFVDVRQCQA
jgi:hypothetical protein